MNLMAAARALDVRRRVSAEERRLCVEPAAAGRLVALNRWDDRVFAQIVACIPGPGRHFLINPCGAVFEEIPVKIDLEGRSVMENSWGDNPAGFVTLSVIQVGAGEFRHTATRRLGGHRVWPGLPRKPARIDPGYAE